MFSDVVSIARCQRSLEEMYIELLQSTLHRGRGSELSARHSEEDSKTESMGDQLC